ncbi:MAG TPA: phosphoglycerate dehydrogenase [Candidatus Acidoferrum sp.]|nr:phosphoglycerate dehydrogenase [Candidatus Acidoferrum sp.]
MRIVVADPISRHGIELLRGAGCEVITPAHDELRGALATADALIVRSATRVTRELLEAGPRLRVVGRAGVGVDNIDVDAATARGVLVMNTPGGNSVSVAEHTLGLMLAIARHIPQLSAAIHAGRWEKSAGVGVELRGKTLGLIGFGRVGSEVARRARAFGMIVLAHDPCITEEAARNSGVDLLPMAQILERSDFLSLHTALNPATEKIIRAETLAQCKRGAILINTARGELVDEVALADALRSGQLAGAGLDVFTEEPPLRSLLIGLPNVVATPHIAGSTREAQEEVGTLIAQQVLGYLTEGALDNAVNLPAVSGEQYRRARPWIEMVTRLGSFVAQISGGRFERVSIAFAGEASELGTSVLRNAALAGLLNNILDEKVNLVNASKIATTRGLIVEELARHVDQGYPDTIEVAVRAGRESRGATAEATVLHGISPRILRVDGVELEAPLAGTMLFFRNRDVPGVIGEIGTILGARGVNIATFALGRDTQARGTEAMALVQVDGAVPEEALKLIGGIGAITEVRLIQLPD